MDSARPSTIRSWVRDYLKQLLNLNDNKYRLDDPTEEVGGGETRLQDQLEIVVRKVLELYVTCWAEQVSPCQTLDKEVQNDLRRSLYQVAERLKSIEKRAALVEALQIVRSHVQRIDDATKESGPDAYSSRFKFVHPVFAKCCPVYLSKEKYVLASVERVLCRFGVDKTLSAEPALHVVNSVACRQGCNSIDI